LRHGTTAVNAARRIGPIGTACRLAVGLALLVLAFADQPAGLIWGVELHELILGLIVLPAASVAIGLLALRYSPGGLRFTSPAGIAANFAVIVALFAIPYTAGAAALFYGTSLLIAGWRGQPDCEVTTWSNLILRRDDQIGCPCFTPLDSWEARRRSGGPNHEAVPPHPLR
jgi:hypothetical protein